MWTLYDLFSIEMHPIVIELNYTTYQYKLYIGLEFNEL